MELLILTILILFNGFFALSEIALVSSKKPRLEQFRVEKRRGAKTALRLLENPGTFLSAIQVGITVISIVTGVYGGLSIADDITPFFERIEAFRNAAHEIALSVTVLTITYFSIVIGELVPKTIAMSNPERIAIRIAPPIFYFSKIFYPFIKLLSFSTSLLTSALGIKKRSEQFTEAELKYMIKMASNEGVIEEEQNLIHEKIFYFSDKRAKHIMTYRTDVECINLNQSEEDIKRDILLARHNIVICCNDNLDNFLGILHIKDYFLALYSDKKIKTADLLVEPLIIPENADAHKVLEMFKLKRKHFCIVVNEYGGFEGIITLHDIMENIIGDMPGEGELYDPDIFVRDDKSVLVSGYASVEILDRVIEGFVTDLEETEYSTVAGFVLSNIDKIPQIGDSFYYEGYKFEIVDIDGNRIDKILVSKIE